MIQSLDDVQGPIDFHGHGSTCEVVVVAMKIIYSQKWRLHSSRFVEPSLLISTWIALFQPGWLYFGFNLQLKFQCVPKREFVEPYLSASEGFLLK